MSEQKESALDTEIPLETSLVRGIQAAINESANFTIDSLRTLLAQTSVFSPDWNSFIRDVSTGAGRFTVTGTAKYNKAGKKVTVSGEYVITHTVLTPGARPFFLKSGLPFTPELTLGMVAVFVKLSGVTGAATATDNNAQTLSTSISILPAIYDGSSITLQGTSGTSTFNFQFEYISE